VVPPLSLSLPEKRHPSRKVKVVGVTTSTPYRTQHDGKGEQERKEEEKEEEEEGQASQEKRKGLLHCGAHDRRCVKKANGLHPSTALALPVGPFVVSRTRRRRKRSQGTIKSSPFSVRSEKEKKKRVGSASCFFQDRDVVE